MTEQEERVARAIEDAAVGYSIRLTRLVDGEHTFELVFDDAPDASLAFRSHNEAHEEVKRRRRMDRARAAIAAMAGDKDSLTTGWRPIAEAPRDGHVPFLVLAPAYGTTGDMVVMQVSLFECRLYPDARGAAIDWEDGITNATHWQPLPPPPTEHGEGEKG